MGRLSRATRVARLALLALLALLAVGLIPTVPARAHAGTATDGLLTVAHDVGPYALTFTIKQAGPASPVLVEIDPGRLATAVTLSLTVVPLGAAAEPAIRLPLAADDPTPLAARFDGGAAGIKELVVDATGPAGAGIARIPFEVAPSRPSTAAAVMRAALIGSTLLLVALAALVGLGPRVPLPRRLLPILAASLLLSFTVAAAAGARQALTSPVATDSQAGGAPRPYANMLLATEPAAPAPGQPTTLTLDFSDGSTGRPVDDLVLTHDALLHGVVVAADGGFFAHVHPSRVAPGRYRTTVAPDRPGNYTFYAEIARRGSGSQVIARPFTVAGPPAAALPPAAPPTGSHEIGDLVVVGSSSTPSFRVGKPTTLSFSVSRDGQPVASLQPWLGMAGHLLARSEDGNVFGHVHAAGGTAAADPAAPDEPVPGILAEPTAGPVRYQPTVGFTYTPPQAGAYRLWLQFKTDDRVVTLPLAITVEAAAAAS